jgi:hypothetical protein
MNIVDLSTSERRSYLTQRKDDRRKVPYPFGSPEWLKFMIKNNLDCPIFDRRKADRRSDKGRCKDDRRKVPYQFGSPEWLKFITKNNLDCLRFDRRNADKRSDKRRLPDRRNQYIAEPIHSKKKYVRIFLTRTEKKIIEDLYLNDLQ